MLLSFSKKHCFLEGDSVGQGLPEVGGRERSGRKGGEDQVLYSQILVPQKQAIYQSTSLIYCQKTRANYT